jgi:enoyl-CoA hydratase
MSTATADQAEAYLERQGRVLSLVINRPAKLNAINAAVETALAEALGQLESDPEVGVLLIRSTGEYFSSGYDLDYRVSDVHDSGGIALRRRYREIHDLFDRVEDVEKPVILAAHGPCLGGALELALSCDFRLASDAARFSFPEIRLGAVAGSGGVSRSTRIVGPAWSRWLTMAGMSVGPEQALSIGLVQAVHPLARFDQEVARFADRLAGLPPEALGLTKLAITLCDPVDRSASRDIERLANSLLLPGEEHRARVRELKERISGGSTS